LQISFAVVTNESCNAHACFVIQEFFDDDAGRKKRLLEKKCEVKNYTSQTICGDNSASQVAEAGMFGKQIAKHRPSSKQRHA
jgi:hypothetical protein